MGVKTGIEWTDATWNPIIGCSRVSEGCRHCYAEGIAARFAGGQTSVYSGLAQMVNGHAQWTGKIAETAQLLNPLKWRKPKRVFVNSMSDLFHENVSDELRDRIFAVMALCPQHTFQVLTKRPERMLAYITRGVGGIVRRDFVNAQFHRLNPTRHPDQHVKAWPLPNVWLGVSVENQAAADVRIPALLEVDAAIRFVSCEPLLGELDLSRWLEPLGVECIDVCPSLRYIRSGEVETFTDPNRNEVYPLCPNCGLVAHWTGYDDGIDWVIVGGESGPGARPMHPDWVRSLRDQCTAAGVPFFFKQWGEWAPGECADKLPTRTERTARWWDGKWIYEELTPRQSEEMHRDDAPDLYRLGKKAAGAWLDGVEHKAFPGQLTYMDIC